MKPIALKAVAAIAGISMLGAFAYLGLRSVSKIGEPGAGEYSASELRGEFGAERPATRNVFLPMKSRENNNVYGGATYPSPSAGAPVETDSGSGDSTADSRYLQVAPDSTPSTPSLSLLDIQNLVLEAIPVPVAQPVPLRLPEVADGDISVVQSGLSSFGEYIGYLSLHNGEMDFDGVKLFSVPYDENGLIISPVRLIEESIRKNNFHEMRDVLLIHKEYAEKKLEWLMSREVAPSIVPIHKKSIALDMLTLELISKSVDVARGNASRDELATYHKQYLATAEKERSSLFAELGLELTDSSFFAKLMKRFGIGDVAMAQIGPFMTGAPFGGRTQQVFPCTCPWNLGAWIKIKGINPTAEPPDGELWLSVYVMLSPLFYPHQSLKTGVWWLGLYLPYAADCEQYVYPSSCIRTMDGYVVEFVGSSK